MNYREISIGESITDSLSQGKEKGYLVTVDANKKLTINLHGPKDQDFDLYVKFNEQASQWNWDFRKITTLTDETIIIGPTNAGIYYIMVHAYMGSGQFSLSTEVPLEDIEITAGQQTRGKLLGNNEALYYRISSKKDQKIVLDLNGPLDADFDLYVRYGERPTNSNYDFRSYSGSSKERIVIDAAKEGRYHIQVHSYKGSGDFTLSASSEERLKESELIVTSKDKLKNKYGQDKFGQIEAKIAEYVQALEGTGIGAKLVYVDDASSLSPYGLSPVNSDSPNEIKMLIDSLDNKLYPRYFLILGGHSIIPFHSLPNPAAEDGDAIVYSDNPYASRGSDYLIPQRALARLPDAASNEFSFFISVLETAVSRIRNAKKDSFGLTASVWTGASNAVFSPIKSGEELKISPPTVEGDILRDWLHKKGYFYFNLHGSEDSANWYGQEGNSYPVAFSPVNINDAEIENAVVCSEACYGANIVDKGVNDALSLKFLDRKAACFVGSTKIAFGPSEPPSTEADLMVLKFYLRIKEGLTFGEAFLMAKQDFARESIATGGGFLDSDDKKTLIEFVMFADPSAKMEES